MLETFAEMMLGISLSAAAGFRVFVPLLALSAAAVLGHLDLPANFDWVETPEALIVFAVACGLEVVGYSIPWFDHALDTIATPAAFIAGTIVTASLAPDLNPVAQWTLALVAGGGTAGLTKGLMNFLRLTSTAASGGIANPFLALFELLTASLLSVLAVVYPIVAGVTVVAGLGFLMSKGWQKFLLPRAYQPVDQPVEN